MDESVSRREALRMALGLAGGVAVKTSGLAALASLLAPEPARADDRAPTPEETHQRVLGMAHNGANLPVFDYYKGGQRAIQDLELRMRSYAHIRDAPLLQRMSGILDDLADTKLYHREKPRDVLDLPNTYVDFEFTPRLDGFQLSMEISTGLVDKGIQPLSLPLTPFFLQANWDADHGMPFVNAAFLSKGADIIAYLTGARPYDITDKTVLEGLKGATVPTENQVIGRRYFQAGYGRDTGATRSNGLPVMDDGIFLHSLARRNHRDRNGNPQPLSTYWPQAETLLRTATQWDPTNLSHWMKYAGTLGNQNKYQLQAEILEHGLIIHSQNSAMHQQLGFVYNALGRYADRDREFAISESLRS